MHATRLCLLLLVLTGLVMGWLGCAQQPVVSDQKQADHSTIDEQRAWVTLQVNEAIDASGDSEGWVQLHTDLIWSQHSEQVLQQLRSEDCTPNLRSEIHSRRLSLVLINLAPTDPTQAALQVRRYWESQGWTVSNVIDSGSVSAGRTEYFRADRADGAGLAFTSNDKSMTLIVESVCSDHASAAVF